MFLRKHLETFGQITLTLNQLLKECGYSIKSHNKSIYSDFREIIKTEIINKEYATCNIDIFTVSPNEMFSLHLSENKNIFFTKDPFVQFNISEYEKITNTNTRVNKSVLVGVYLFIKQYIINSEYAIKVSYPSKQQIKNGLGISSIDTVEKAISTLVDMKMLFIKNEMYVENKEIDNQFIPTRNVFALNESDLCGDSVLLELETLYGKKVYNKKDVPGEIKYLTREME